MMVLLTAQTAVFGAVQVFIVVAAFELLDLGEGGVGYLSAAIGIGASTFCTVFHATSRRSFSSASICASLLRSVRSAG